MGSTGAYIEGRAAQWPKGRVIFQRCNGPASLNARMASMNNDVPLLMQVLHFYVSDFWVWLGLTVAIGLVAEAVGDIFGRRRS